MCAAAWVVLLSSPLSTDALGELVAVAVVVLVGDIVLLNIRLGRNGNGFTWSEAALIVAVAIGGWACFVAALGLVYMQIWLIIVGAVAVILATGGLLFEYYTGSRRAAEH